jgi:RNA polymerase-interacting CarD/CdnL/TRCF family regulator
MDVFARAWAIAKADSEEMKRITSTPSTGQDEDAAKRAKESEAAKIAEIQERNKKNRENLNKGDFDKYVEEVHDLVKNHNYPVMDAVRNVASITGVDGKALMRAYTVAYR